MTWLVWRQRRAEGIVAVVFLLALTLVVLPSGLHLHQLESVLDAGRCNGASGGARCAPALDSFNAVSRSLTGIVPWLNLLPGLAGAFIGAPLVAREIEEGTWRLVWSQGVTRRHWLSAQLVGIGVFMLLASVLLTAILTWWLTPLNHIDGRFGSSGHGFDFYGTVPVAWALLAAAIGVLSGIAIRRVIPAMAATVGSYLLIRLPVEFSLRPHYLPPEKLWGIKPTNAQPLGADNWIFGQNLVAPHSHRVLSASQFDQLQHVARAASPSPLSLGQDAQYLESLDHYFLTHGYTYVFTYQPADRFWEFQGIETGICLVLATVAVVVARQLMSRRLT